MKINKGYKYKIKPNKEQILYFEQAFGCNRKLYNTYVDYLYNQLEQQNYINGLIKNIKLPSPKSIKDNFDYMKEIDSLSFCNTQIGFKNAIKKFNKTYDKKSYTKRSLKRKKTLNIIPTFRDLKGIPKFKSKKMNQDSFKTNNQSRGGKWRDIRIQDNLLYMPKIKGSIKIVFHRQLPKNSIIKNITISKDCRGTYYASLCVEYDKDIKKISSNKVLGLDYSQHDFYVSSEGEKANYPRYYRKMENKLKLEQQKLSRKQLKSNNWIKQKKKISKIQLKIANQRKDWLHKKSYELANNFDVICVEDIDLRGMGQTLHLAKNLHDNGFGMFRTMLKYKLEERGKQFIKIDRFYPSSKRCNDCGHINKELKLSDREWVCSECGSIIDRDYNAALNIKEVGTTLLAW